MEGIPSNFSMGFGKDGKGVIMRENRSQALGTLAALSALIIGTNLATTERFRMLKAEIWATLTGLTTGEGTGLLFGLADGDLSVAEIEEAIESNGPLGPNDTVTEEQASRAVWLFGAIDRETGTEAIFENEDGGHMLVLKPRWTFASVKSWNWFVYNMGAAPTTGATIFIRGKSFGVWVT